MFNAGPSGLSYAQAAKSSLGRIKPAAESQRADSPSSFLGIRLSLRTWRCDQSEPSSIVGRSFGRHRIFSEFVGDSWGHHCEAERFLAGLGD